MTVSQEVNDALKRHSVIVSEGSGVLIQPASDEYSYILTAKHVVEGKSEDEVDVVDTYDKKIGILGLYLHGNLDAAIIKIEPQDNLSLTAFSDCHALPPRLKLRGFPGKKRENGRSCLEQLEAYDLLHVDSSSTHWTYRNESQAPYDDVKGCSGGGVFYSESYSKLNEVFIAGVEYELTGEGDRLEHDHIGCVPICVFDDIIDSHNLAALKPLHLSGFQHLYKGIFPQKYYENSVLPFEYRQFLPLLNSIRNHCNRSLAGLTFAPQQLLQEHPDKFSVGGRPPYELEDENCWCKFLEFLTLVSLVNERGFDQINPGEVFKEFKVVYIRSEQSWHVHFEDVLNLDTTGLEPNGKIILFFNDTPDRCAVIPKEQIDRCVRKIDETGDPDFIDAANAIRRDGHTMIHWFTLHDELIFRRRNELENLVGTAEYQTKIQELYNQYLRFKEVVRE